jgi:hypothetical protein
MNTFEASCFDFGEFENVLTAYDGEVPQVDQFLQRVPTGEFHQLLQPPTQQQCFGGFDQQQSAFCPEQQDHPVGFFPFSSIEEDKSAGWATTSAFAFEDEAMVDANTMAAHVQEVPSEVRPITSKRDKSALDIYSDYEMGLSGEGFRQYVKMHGAALGPVHVQGLKDARRRRDNRLYKQKERQEQVRQRANAQVQLVAAEANLFYMRAAEARTLERTAALYQEQAYLHGRGW